MARARGGGAGVRGQRSGTPVIDWSEYRIAILKRRWQEGIGAAQIADEIGYAGMAGAVTSKATRMHLTRGKPVGSEPEAAAAPIKQRLNCYVNDRGVYLPSLSILKEKIIT